MTSLALICSGDQPIISLPLPPTPAAPHAPPVFAGLPAAAPAPAPPAPPDAPGRSPATCFLATSRHTVDAARPGPSRAAICRYGSFCARPTAISSRSHRARNRPDPATGPFPFTPPAATTRRRASHAPPPPHPAASSTPKPARTPSQNATRTSRASTGRPSVITTNLQPATVATTENPPCVNTPKCNNSDSRCQRGHSGRARRLFPIAFTCHWTHSGKCLATSSQRSR